MPAETTYSLNVISNPSEAYWNELLMELPGAHILQSQQWAEIKRQNGWLAEYLLWIGPDQKPAAAAVLHRKRVPMLPVCLLYAPRGPLLDWSNAGLRHQVLADLHRHARENQAIFLKIDPEVPLAWSEDPLARVDEDAVGLQVRTEMERAGWIFSQDQLQFRNTVLLDISPSEDVLLQRMKQKTRYNIRLAERKGVVIRDGTTADLELLYHMYAETSMRDHFAIRSKEYYLDVWSRLMRNGIAQPLIAEVGGQPVSAVIVFIFARRGYYFYGMSTEAHRDKMPNHLLQWHAILLCKARGCLTYDFWGAPDEFHPEDSMYGVYRFKEGFTGRVLFGLGAWDDPIHPMLYRFYTRTLPRLLNVMRWLGRRRVSREVQE
jgi:lipid II:glycine glycyltransferase (peptidoglycan interpeptide bridge formation enzyme)